VPVTISILASTVVLKTPPTTFGDKLNSFSSTNNDKNKLKGYHSTQKKKHPSNRKQENNEFIKKQLTLRHYLKTNSRTKKTTEKERAKRDSEYNNFEPNDSLFTLSRGPAYRLPMPLFYFSLFFKWKSTSMSFKWKSTSMFFKWKTT
jgi:hypothetical protein